MIVATTVHRSSNQVVDQRQTSILLPYPTGRIFWGTFPGNELPGYHLQSLRDEPSWAPYSTFLYRSFDVSGLPASTKPCSSKSGIVPVKTNAAGIFLFPGFVGLTG